MKKGKIGRKQAFSLAEVMIALIIVAILMAASAPLINRRVDLDNFGGDFGCLWENSTNGIYYNKEGAGKVGIGVEPTSSNGLHIKSSSDAPQISFYDKNSNSVSNVLGVYNNNIILGTAENVSGSGNVVIGHATEAKPADGNKLIIGARNSTTPLLYGNLSSGDLNLQINGRLEIKNKPIYMQDSTGVNKIQLNVDGRIIGSYIYAKDASLIAKNYVYVGTNDAQDTGTILLDGPNGNITSKSGSIRVKDVNGNIKVQMSAGGLRTNDAGLDMYVGSNLQTRVHSSGPITTLSPIYIGSTVTDYTKSRIKLGENGSITLRSGSLHVTTDDPTVKKVKLENSGVSLSDCPFYLNDAAGNNLITLSHGGGGIFSEKSIWTNSNMYVGGNSKTATIRLVAGGDISAAGSITSNGTLLTSDIRLKKDIGDMDLGLEIIRQVDIKEFKFKNETEKYNKHIGVIAQDIQKILPNVVRKDDKGFLSISANDIFFVAINAIKQLDKELQNIKQLLENKNINKLKTENEKLKNEIRKLKEENQKFEKRLKKIEKQLKLD